MTGATIPETIQDVLQADATLTAIVASANIYTSGSLGGSFINETDTEDAYETIADSGGVQRLKPCVVITRSTGPDPIPEGSTGYGRAEWLNVGAYDRDDYADTQSMLERIHTLLHDTWQALTDGRSFHVEHVDTPTREETDDSIPTGTARQASYEMARYLCVTEWA